MSESDRRLIDSERRARGEAERAEQDGEMRALVNTDHRELPGDRDLHDTMDARVWAERFVRRVKEKPELATDEGAMLAWFAGAIMAGYDRRGRG